MTVLLRRPDKALLASAVEIAEMAETSDATVVRTAKSLGFSGLAELRTKLLHEGGAAATQAERLARTLAAAQTEGGPLAHVLVAHHEALAALQTPDFAKQFAQALEIIASGQRLFLFGLGPSAALSTYCGVQFGRLGLDCRLLTNTGIGLADQLSALGGRDALLMLAYAPFYREAEIVIERAERLEVPVALITDGQGEQIEIGGGVCLDVPRGRTDHFALHGATFVLIEALVAGLAERLGDAALKHLGQFGALRGEIDKDWKKRRASKRRRSTTKD